jgi:hypothetical protein
VPPRTGYGTGAAAPVARLCAAVGQTFDLDGEVEHAFPLPDRLPGLETFPGLPEQPDDAAVQRIAEPWRPFRTWAAVLIRVSGDGDGLPWRQVG